MLRRVSTAVTLPLLLSLSPVRSADYPPDIGTVISHSYANFSGNALCTATAIGFFNYTIVASGLFIVQNGSDVIQDIGTGKETRWFYVSDFNTTIGQPGTTRADCVPIAGQYVQDKDSGSWLIEDASTTQTMLVSVITDEAGKASTAPGIYNDNETTTLQYFLTAAIHTPSSSSTTSTTGQKTTTPAPIIGGIIGGVALLILLSIMGITLCRRHRSSQRRYRAADLGDMYNPVLPRVTRDGNEMDLLQSMSMTQDQQQAYRALVPLLDADHDQGQSRTASQERFEPAMSKPDLHAATVRNAHVGEQRLGIPLINLQLQRDPIRRPTPSPSSSSDLKALKAQLIDLSTPTFSAQTTSSLALASTLKPHPAMEEGTAATAAQPRFVRHVDGGELAITAGTSSSTSLPPITSTPPMYSMPPSYSYGATQAVADSGGEDHDERE